MKVIVCGGREFADKRALFSSLDAIHAETPISLVIQGEARGADRLASAWAFSRGIPAHGEAAKWNLYGRTAGGIRNSVMLDLEPDKVIAFSGGPGTANMVYQAHRRQVPVDFPLEG